MKWFWIPTVFYLVTQVKSWPTTGDVSTDPQKITSIKKVDTGTEICLSKAVIEDTNTYTLSVVTPEKTIDYETTGSEDTNCLTFPENLNLIETKTYGFIVHHEKDLEIVVEGIIENCPKFPTSSDCTMVTDPLGNSNYLLRVKAGGVENLELSGATKLINDADIAYYNGITEVPFTTKPCLKTSPEDIILCNDEITISLTTTDEVKVDSATLKLDVSEVNLQLVDALGADTFDIIVTKENGKINFCSKGPTELICAVDREEHESGVFDIRVIGKNAANEIKATGSVTIHDRDLILSSIGADILEGIWLHTHEVKDKKLYQFQLLDVTPTVDPVNVDCTNLVSTHCYGYILGVSTSADLYMKVKPTDGTTYVTTDENQNIYKKTSTSQELAILSRHTKRHANQLMADVNICFEHLTPTEGRSFSHYEMLIINEKGQWLKHRIMEEEEEAREGRLCFTPFAINTRDFDLTEGTRVVVIQRGVDGFTVLATGQSKLL